MRSRAGREDGVEDATLRLVLDHAGELLRFARRFSHCADDAHDAYQRAVEILVRRMRVDPPAQPLAWMRTVLRHESLAVRTEREQLLGRTEVDLDRHEDRASADPAEQAVGHERLRHTAEALRRLKPQEATALVLRAEGLSYAEICERTGWTYTKTNRCVTEGRRALLDRLSAIESGAECARWVPLLSSLADGEASARDVADLRPHLRGCSSCRAMLRDFHAAPAQVALLVPPAIVPAVAGRPHGSLLGHAEVVLHALAERATLLTTRVQGAFEALPATKVAAVAASTAALAGGGVAIEHANHARGARPADVASAPASAPTARQDLTTSVFPGGAAGDVTAAHRSDRTASHGEFGGREPAMRPEFPPQAAPASTEFGSAPSVASAGGEPAQAASAPSAAPEFGSP
jgi:RNA polymerase sigma factor (sigma-70 family)